MYAPYPHALYYPNYPHQQHPNVPNQQYWNIHNGQDGNQLPRQTVQMTEHSKQQMQNAEASMQTS
eukprot:11583451-Ditylum_brightwellii.AAC.1